MSDEDKLIELLKNDQFELVKQLMEGQDLKILKLDLNNHLIFDEYETRTEVGYNYYHCDAIITNLSMGNGYFIAIFAGDYQFSKPAITSDDVKYTHFQINFQYKSGVWYTSSKQIEKVLVKVGLSDLGKYLAIDDNSTDIDQACLAFVPMKDVLRVIFAKPIDYEG